MGKKMCQVSKFGWQMSSQKKRKKKEDNKRIACHIWFIL